MGLIARAVAHRSAAEVPIQPLAWRTSICCRCGPKKGKKKEKEKERKGVEREGERKKEGRKEGRKALR